MRTQILFVSLTLVASAARADYIGFDDLPNGTVVTTQYPHVTFSSVAGAANYAYDFQGARILMTGKPTITGVEDTYLQFDAPVQSLTFWAIEPNFAGQDATFRIFQNGAYTADVPLIGLGGSGNKFVDLSAYANITRLEITGILRDTGLENGIGWDDFNFQVVPEPGTLAVLGLGMALWALRRR